MKPFHSLQSRGITLVELLIAVSICTLIGIVVVNMQIDIFRLNRKLTGSLTTVERAQRLLRPMTAEIRSASISALGAFPIATALPYDLAFYSDTDSDGTKEYIRYHLVDTTLYKTVVYQSQGIPAIYDISAVEPVVFIEGIENVAQQAPMFRYFSNQYVDGGVDEIVDADTVTSGIRMVRIMMMLATGDDTPVFTISSDVAIRNLKQQ
jgi:hypothetical protein